jgi:hypothetical protein
MGGMGRAFDGGYAEYTVVPRESVVPFQSDLSWSVIGQVPETLQTAYGCPTIYRLEDIPTAHADIDANRVAGKLVGVTAVTD